MAATAETIQNCIKQRLGFDTMLKLSHKHGFATVMNALDETGYSYESRRLEEIGSSDVSYMCESFYRALGEPWEWGMKT